MTSWDAAAERATKASPKREDDLSHLAAVLDDHDHELQTGEAEAFASMRERLYADEKSALSPKQREWLRKVYERVTGGGYENLVSTGRVKLGKAVETPACLRRENLPMKPPGRR
jgi:hypothetical protein